MARPRLNPAERRTRQINVRVTEAEAVALAEQAGRARLTVAAYLRRRGLRRRVRAATERRLAAEDRRELNRIGVNLNQMVRLMHSGRAVHPGLREAVERARGAGGDDPGRGRRVMVGTIGAATSGFGGVAGYCCGGGGGGEEREEERMPGMSGAKEEERERDEAGSLSARERQQEQERHGPGRSAGGQGDDEERERRRAEREKKVETEARRVRRVEWTETRNLATNDPMRGARIMEATARDASELKRLSGVKATGRKLTKPLCHYSLRLGEGREAQPPGDGPGRHREPPGAGPGGPPSADRGAWRHEVSACSRDREPGES